MADQINLIYKHFLNSEGISTDSRKIKKLLVMGQLINRPRYLIIVILVKIF